MKKKSSKFQWVDADGINIDYERLVSEVKEHTKRDSIVRGTYPS